MEKKKGKRAHVVGNGDHGLTRLIHTWTVGNSCIQTFLLRAICIIWISDDCLAEFCNTYTVQVASYRSLDNSRTGEIGAVPAGRHPDSPDVLFVQCFARNRICCRLDRVGSTHPGFRAAFPSLHRLFPIRSYSLFLHS